MFPEDYLIDHYCQGYLSAERDHEDGADAAAMLLIADASYEINADHPEREPYYRGRLDYCAVCGYAAPPAGVTLTLRAPRLAVSP
jgi:hypothetical protein